MDSSFFLFGPRGTGKTSWVRKYFPKAIYIDLLKSSVHFALLGQPDRLENMIPDGFDDWIIIDEVQKLPFLLNEVHRLIESKGYRFVLTGSSARTLRKKGVNLLAGRALMCRMHPLTAEEMGVDFDIKHSLKWGHLPMAQVSPKPDRYLESYVSTYLREEVQQEGLTRDLGAFSRFLETASLSQGQVINMAEVARECALSRRIVDGYFLLAEDLLLSCRIPVFSKRARRKLIAHSKFYFFDVGIYRTLRPRGPLDTDQEVNGAALESLVLQELQATNDLYNYKYKIHYWRTRTGLEVDFILYGPQGLHAIEVKCSRNISPNDLKGLKAFGADYPEAQLTLLYGGSWEESHGNIRCLPVEKVLPQLSKLMLKNG